MEASTFNNDIARRVAERIKAQEVVSHELSRILVLYTGGTIGMVRSERGYIPASKIFHQLIRSNYRFNDQMEFEKRLKLGQIEPESFITPLSFYGKRTIYKIEEMHPLIDSSSMRLENWVRIAEFIEANYNRYDGFVVLHGTDTMPYTASALSFMLENLQKPVVITGSQIPITEIRCDAEENLLGAITIAGHFDIPEVTLYFSNQLYRGNRSIKLDNSSFEPFTSPNFPPLITAGISFDVNWHLVRKSSSSSRFQVFKTLEGHIQVIQFSPITTPESIRQILQPPTKVAILLSYGAGNIPSTNQEIMQELRDGSERGILLVNVTQCKKGGVSFSYEAGRVFQELGGIGAHDMTLECAICKLSYLFGKGYTLEEVKRKFQENLRGELTPDLSITQFSRQGKEFITEIARGLEMYTQAEEQMIEDAIIPVIACLGCKQNEVNVLQTIAGKGFSLSKADYELRTPLHIACAFGSTEVVNFLLESGVEINVVDAAGVTPVFEALRQGHYSIAETLIRHGAIIRASHETLAPLLCQQGLLSAAILGDLRKIQLIYEAGGNINSSDYDGRTLGHIAAAKGQIEVIRYLKDNTDFDFNAVDAFGHKPVDEAIRNNHQELLAYFNNQQDMQEDEIFLNSIYRADLGEIYRILRVSSIAPHKARNSRGYSAFHIAALNTNFSVVDFLEKFVRDQYQDSADEILKEWVTALTEDQFTCIHFAAFRGSLKLVEKFISIGGNANSVNKQGLGIMHIAAQGDQPLLLSYFYEKGYSILIEDEKGGTPLHWAAYLGCEVAASLLLA